MKAIRCMRASMAVFACAGMFAGAFLFASLANAQRTAKSIDAHLGDSRLLKLNNFTISQGASIRIIGENVTTNQGAFFLARLVQQGTQVLAVRSMQGMPLLPFVRKSASNSQGGAR